MDQFKNQPIEEFTDYARRNLLDLLEASYGHTDSWWIVRSRVLQIFGRDGFGRYRSEKKENKNGTGEKNRQDEDRH